MKLVAGLGNPGRRYADTRHNAGYRVIEILAKRCGATQSRFRFDGEAVEVFLGGQSVLLLEPQTYMNRSGRSVLAARDFYKLDNSDILVVCDDFNLPLAKLRLRPKGSAGGQKGLQDIIRCLGGEHVPRLRIGIGSPPPNWDVADYVLSRFSEEERPVIEAAFGRSAEAVVAWVRDGIENCMNQFNAD